MKIQDKRSIFKLCVRHFKSGNSNSVNLRNFHLTISFAFFKKNPENVFSKKYICYFGFMIGRENFRPRHKWGTIKFRNGALQFLKEDIKGLLKFNFTELFN